jgi:hypothetical protein
MEAGALVIENEFDAVFLNADPALDQGRSGRADCRCIPRL